MANNKFKNTKEVVFEEDHGRFKKGEKHFIHKDLVKKLTDRKVKVKVSNFDYDEAVSKARKANAEAAEAQEKANKA